MKPALSLTMLTLAFSTPTLAQENRGILPDAQARVIVQKYAQCVVRARPDRVRASLRAYFAGKKLPMPVVNDCAMTTAYDSTSISFSTDVYRYAMAEALYAADYGNAGPQMFDTVPLKPPPETEPLNEAPLAAKPKLLQAAREAHDQAVAERYLLIVADCITRTAPAETKALIMAPAQTSSETAAVAGLQPFLMQCLPEGQTVRLNRPKLRGVLALAAYRLSDAVAPIASTKDKAG